MRGFLISLMVLVCGIAHGQGFAVTLNGTTTVSINGTSVLRPMPGARLYVCNGSQSTCVGANSVPVYSDIGLTTPIAQPLTVDSLGNTAFYVGSGHFNYTIYNSSLQVVKTYPFTVSGSGIGAQYPTSVNGMLYPNSFPGATIREKIAAAFASQAGTSSAPATSVVVDLAPNQTYNFSQSLEIPNQTATPYITNPILDCHGSTLVYSGTGTAPAVLVHGQNAADATNSGSMRNCRIIRADSTGPVMQVNDRMGWQMSNVDLEGGQDSYLVNLTNTDGGPGYMEQSRLNNIAFENPLRDGIRVINGTGGNNGYQYNYGDNLRFQFQGATSGGYSSGSVHAQIHFVGGGINAFNGSYKTTVNTGGDGTTYFIQADGPSTGSVLSTFIEYNGEATSGSMLFMFGGGAVVDLQCRNLSRTAFAYDPQAWCHGDIQTAGNGSGPYGTLLGSLTHTLEYNFQNGDRDSGTFDNGDNWVRFHAYTNGTESHGIEQVLNCPTDTTHPNPWDSTGCINSLYHMGTGGWGIGAGFNDSTSSAQPVQTLDVHGTIESVSGYYANGIVGVSCSGVPTSSYAVTLGIVTHC